MPRGFRTLDIVDDSRRECGAIEADRSLPGLRVKRGAGSLASTIGLPQSILVITAPPQPRVEAFRHARFRSAYPSSEAQLDAQMVAA
jgi:hypothetical protein